MTEEYDESCDSSRDQYARSALVELQWRASDGAEAASNDVSSELTCGARTRYADQDGLPIRHTTAVAAEATATKRLGRGRRAAADTVSIIPTQLIEERA